MPFHDQNSFSRSETDFKDDIQNYINIVGTKKRNVTKKKPAQDKAVRPKLDIEGIKAKLVQTGKKPNSSKILPEASSNVEAVKESLVQQFFAGHKANDRPDLDFTFDSPSSSVTKMKDMFEFGSNQTSEPSTPAKTIEIKSLQVL